MRRKPIGLGKTQAGQHHSGLGFERVAVAVPELSVQGMETLAHPLVLFTRRVEFGDLRHGCSISCSMARRSPKTDMHSPITVRPESVNPSCGR